MKTLIKFIAGLAVIILTFWGIDAISDALTVPNTTWLTGAVGIGYLLGALAIVVWFVDDASKKIH
jgi:hypothetical protein